MRASLFIEICVIVMALSACQVGDYSFPDVGDDLEFEVIRLHGDDAGPVCEISSGSEAFQYLKSVANDETIATWSRSKINYVPSLQLKGVSIDIFLLRNGLLVHYGDPEAPISIIKTVPENTVTKIQSLLCGG